MARPWTCSSSPSGPRRRCMSRAAMGSRPLVGPESRRRGAGMKRFELELDALKEKILEMGVVAERMVSRASEALVKRDRAIVADVLEGEETLDRFQVEIDGEAVRLITVYTPTAKDLRFLLMVVRINTELERI